MNIKEIKVKIKRPVILDLGDGNGKLVRKTGELLTFASVEFVEQEDYLARLKKLPNHVEIDVVLEDKTPEVEKENTQEPLKANEKLPETLNNDAKELPKQVLEDNTQDNQDDVIEYDEEMLTAMGYDELKAFAKDVLELDFKGNISTKDLVDLCMKA